MKRCPLTKREVRMLREWRAFWNSVASGEFGAKLDDADYRQRMMRNGEEFAEKADSDLRVNKEHAKKERAQ